MLNTQAMYIGQGFALSTETVAREGLLQSLISSQTID